MYTRFFHEYIITHFPVAETAGDYITHQVVPIAVRLFIMQLKGAVIEMSRVKVRRSYRQLMAESNALGYYIQQRKLARCKCKLTNEQLAELESDEALLKEIENDIQYFRDNIIDK